MSSQWIFSSLEQSLKIPIGIAYNSIENGKWNTKGIKKKVLINPEEGGNRKIMGLLEGREARKQRAK